MYCTEIESPCGTCFFIPVQMNYTETIDYLYKAAPLFQQVGGAAYKEGLYNTRELDRHFGHPHRQYPCIHVAGTNGKGSCAHTLAAMLQHKGLRVGLYTSPHLVDFRERIRVNGLPVPEDYVVDFVREERAFFEPLHPSFFELTTAMAFRYFADARVDIAVIEVGLGGRLDCTNIVDPLCSIITNISFDHTQFLGNTLAAIAGEKAGIIKPGRPVVVGETVAETRPVFLDKAAREGAPIRFADEEAEVLESALNAGGTRHYRTRTFGDFNGELAGDCQVRNADTILCAAKVLQPLVGLSREDITCGFARVCEATGLQGRWQQLQSEPEVVCDTGHNTGGWQYLSGQLAKAVANHPHVRVVFGMAADKDVSHVLQSLPKEAVYYWTQASVRRAMDVGLLAEKAAGFGLSGNGFVNVADAYREALKEADKEDFIFVGGSSFVVADLLTMMRDCGE